MRGKLATSRQTVFHKPQAQACQTLWASLKDVLDKRENHKRTTLIILEENFIYLKNKNWRPEPTLKNGAYSEKPYD